MSAPGILPHIVEDVLGHATFRQGVGERLQPQGQLQSREAPCARFMG